MVKAGVTDCAQSVPVPVGASGRGGSHLKKPYSRSPSPPRPRSCSLCDPEKQPNSARRQDAYVLFDGQWLRTRLSGFRDRGFNAQGIARGCRAPVALTGMECAHPPPRARTLRTRASASRNQGRFALFPFLSSGRTLAHLRLDKPNGPDL